MKQVRCIVSAVILGCLLLSGAGDMVWGQAAVPPTEGIDEHHDSKMKLDADVREAVNDYIDYLNELESVLLDYTRYFSKCTDKENLAEQKDLLTLAAKLSSGIYLMNLQQLSDDLKKLEQQLRTRERELRTQDIQEYKIVRNLRRELEILSNYQSEINTHIFTDEKLKPQLQAYFLRKYSSQKQSMNDIQYKLSYTGDSLQYIKLQMFFDSVQEHFPNQPVPSPPESPKVNVNVTVSKTPPVPPSKDMVFTQQTGASEVVREFTDSIEVPSKNMTIYVSSGVGDITITGWNKKWVRAQSTVYVSSSTEESAEQLAGRVGLSLSQKRDSVGVDLLMPRIRSLGLTINRARLTVFMPSGNNIVCRNSYGKVKVSGIRGKVSLVSRFADINIKDINGYVNISNKMGSLALSDIAGKIDVRTSHSPIDISGSSGMITVQNSFAPVDITSCTGKLSIQNSGDINIEDFTGPVEITNVNGKVMIRKSEGTFSIHNTFQPIILEELSGTITVYNKYAMIDIYDSNGPIQAQNSFAMIRTRDINGTLRLKNENGDIDVRLLQGITGPSIIQVSYGDVKLSLADGVNIIVDAQTIGGTIKGTLPFTVETSGKTKKALVALGSGGPSLKINGTNTTIVLNKNK